jgi:hypothetical protein
LVPVVDLAALVPDLLQLFHRQALGPCILRVDHDGDAVVGHLYLSPLDPRVGEKLLLVRLDLARGVVGVGLPGGELLEPTAGPRDADRHAHVGVLLLEELRRGLGERTDRARAVYANVP